MRAEILVDFAEVLRARGDVAGSANALAEAIALHEEKGNVLPAERCRGLLAAICSGRADGNEAMIPSTRFDLPVAPDRRKDLSAHGLCFGDSG
jgi:hypothetical protein